MRQPYYSHDKRAPLRVQVVKVIAMQQARHTHSAVWHCVRFVTCAAPRERAHKNAVRGRAAASLWARRVNIVRDSPCA